MGNLGMYQKMTTYAKKVGGPQKLIVLVALFGYVAGKTAEWPIKKGIKAISQRNRKNEPEEDLQILKEYVVNKEAVDNQGLRFEVGDIIRVLEKDGDAILVERMGDCDNPYSVSESFLETIASLK